MGDSPGGAPAPRPVSEDGDSIGTRRPVNSRNSWRKPTVLDCQYQLIFYSIFRRKYFTDKVTFFLRGVKEVFPSVIYVFLVMISNDNDGDDNMQLVSIRHRDAERLSCVISCCFRGSRHFIIIPTVIAGRHHQSYR